jgi:carotenoid cleavage dioxygenase
MDNRLLGRPSQHAYSPHIAPAPELLFDGFVKYDTTTGASETHLYGDARYGGETVFAPRVGASAADDDGYVLTFVTDAATGDSEVIVVDAQRPADAPVCRVRIPQRVPIGYHSWWIDADELSSRIP